MKKPIEVPNGKGQCLQDDDFYAYITRPPGQRAPEHIQAHLATCDRCRKELAELIKMLYPEGRDDVEPEPSEREIEDTLSLIQKATQAGTSEPSGRTRWYRWGAIAAAAVLALGLSSFGALFLYERNRSQAFCDQARASLEQVYAPQSPSDLRLDLPFSPATSHRSAAGDDNVENAEKSFNKALGVREGMREALLGLGYIELRRGQFSKAQDAFNGILGAGRTDAQALLGRGVSRFEEGLAVTDPLLRDARLRGALEDFEGVLKLKPGSNEALYDKIRVLYELGRHKDALREIDAYLARDADSIWAVKLRSLKTTILMTRTEAIDAEVYRAAKARDAPALATLARVVPHKVLPALRSLVIDSIAFEDQPETKNKPGTADLQWAAHVLAEAYTGATGDRSYDHLFSFYARLTPQQRRMKKGLDERLEALVAGYSRGNTQSGLRESESLIRGFGSLGDYWELVRVHQFRATILGMGNTDFRGATGEYQNMLEAAEHSWDPDLIARSLSALGSSYVGRERYDDALRILSRLKTVAQANHMEQWVSWGSMSAGNVYIRLNQLEDSLREYSGAIAASYRLKDPIVLVASIEGQAIIMKRMGRYTEADNLYAESGRQMEAALREGLLKAAPEVQFRRLSMLYERGLLALKIHEPKTAEGFFKEALSSPVEGMLSLMSYNRVGLAQAYFDEGRLREAGGEIDAVLDVIAANRLPDIAWQANTLKGHLLSRAGNKSEALTYYRRAEDILGEMRRNVSSPDMRQSFYDHRFDPSRGVASLLYDLNKDPVPALEQADIAKGMTLREYLEGDPAQSGSQATGPFWATRGGIAASLPPGIVTLEYFLASDKILAFVSGSRGIEAVSLNIRTSDLSADITSYLESIKRNDGTSFGSRSRVLHRELIEPLMPMLGRQRVETLVILPDGPLHLLPFGSLTDSGGHFLLEKFALSYAPTRSILQYCLGMNKTERFTAKSTVLLMDGRSSLAGASQELAHLASIFVGSNRLVSSEDLPALGPIVPNYDIIHFSGHASLYRGKPRLTFSSPRGETYLESSMIEKWKLKNNRLVSLLGCDTGIGPIFEGETPWGLVPAFLKAGSPALLLSLMPIDDASAGILTTQFYNLLKGGSISRARALREAQLSLLQDLGSQARTRPGSWAPFVLVGDPR